MNPAPKTIQELALAVQGEVIGNPNLPIHRLVHPRLIQSADELALILEPEAVQLLQLHAKTIKAALVPNGIEIPEGLLEAYIVVEKPRVALATLLHLFKCQPHHEPGIHPTAIVHETAKIHPSVAIGPYSVIGPNVIIGEGSVILDHVTMGAKSQLNKNGLIYSGVRIGEETHMGSHVTIHHNASIGADGFSYVTPETGSIESAKKSGGKIEAQNTEIIKIQSIGNVIIEDNVEIGACATIDRANLGPTLIKKGTKIDNLVMIGHNNTIGENCMIVAQAGVAGSCNIGNRVVLAGQSGLKDHTTIGDDAIVMAQSGVMHNVNEKSIVMGSPALPQRDAFQQYALMGRLSDMRKDLMALKKQVQQLEAQLLQASQKSEEPASV